MSRIVVTRGLPEPALRALRDSGADVWVSPHDRALEPAELAIALMLMITRRLGEGERLIRTGELWAWSIDFMLGRGLRGKTLGIVGYGEIGRATAARARAFGMEVVYTRRGAGSDPGRVELEELLERSHAVSLHCPLTPATHH